MAPHPVTRFRGLIADARFLRTGGSTNGIWFTLSRNLGAALAARVRPIGRAHPTAGAARGALCSQCAAKLGPGVKCADAAECAIKCRAPMKGIQDKTGRGPRANQWACGVDCSRAADERYGTGTVTKFRGHIADAQFRKTGGSTNNIWFTMTQDSTSQHKDAATWWTKNARLSRPDCWQHIHDHQHATKVSVFADSCAFSNHANDGNCLPAL